MHFLCDLCALARNNIPLAKPQRTQSSGHRDRISYTFIFNIMWPFNKNKSNELPRHLQVGQAGEDAGCRALWKRGYRILERNFRSGNDEVDIIAERHRVIYFVEVKTRSEVADPEAALEAVDEGKRGRIREAARHYLSRFETDDVETRFKVITVSLDEKMKVTDVRMFEE
jgi:putative endonuclease